MRIDVEPGDPPFTPAPPPWTLTGDGLVVLYRRPPPAFLAALVPPALLPRYAGGPAVLMLVDYADSAVGPYRELLFVPGRFRFLAGTWPVITQIVVSTWASVANGRRNWAIPKEQATFERSAEARREHWRVTADSADLAHVRYRPRGPRLPVTTALLPRRLATVAQPRGEDLVLTALSASGRCRMATLEDSRFGAGWFPEGQKLQALLALQVEGFRMTFPEPRIVPAGAT